MGSYKCNSCAYYAEEYAQYIHATVPVCNYKGEYKCQYVKNENKEQDSDEMSIQT